jgi:O-antigen/teichoic acid export membrane protein
LSRNIKDSKFFTDFIWYFAGSIIPAIVSFLKLSVFTRHFSPEDYGIFALVSGTYTYLSMALYTWISACVWRFYLDSKNKGEQVKLFSHLSFLFGISTIVLTIISLIWSYLSGSALVTRLVAFSLLQLITGQILQFFLIVIIIEGKALLYNVINIFQVSAAFGLIFLFAFIMHSGIDSFLSSQVVVNTFLIFIVFLVRQKYPLFSFKTISKPYLIELIRYGSVGLITNIGLMVLSLIDRYIIAIYYSVREVGLYNQIYLIGQYSIYQLVQVFFNTINPSLLKILTEKKDSIHKDLVQYVKLFILIFLPITILTSLFSKQVAEILVGENFRSGHDILPYIMFSSLIYGLTLFNEAKLKFEKRYNVVLIGISIACTINILSNFLLIPICGYKIAAITTLSSYIVLFVIYYLWDDFKYFNNKSLNSILLGIMLLGGFIITDYLLRNLLNVNINSIYTILEAIVFVLIYFIFLRKEIFACIRKIK